MCDRRCLYQGAPDAGAATPPRSSLSDSASESGGGALSGPDSSDASGAREAVSTAMRSSSTTSPVPERVRGVEHSFALDDTFRINASVSEGGVSETVVAGPDVGPACAVSAMERRRTCGSSTCTDRLEFAGAAVPRSPTGVATSSARSSLDVAGLSAIKPTTSAEEATAMRSRVLDDILGDRCAGGLRSNDQTLLH